MSDTIIITGVIDLDPARRDAAIDATRSVMEATRTEEGCEHYSFSADLTDPGRFYVAEQWASAADLEAHLATPHLAAFLGSMGDFGITAINLTRWEGATGSKMM